MTAVSTTTEHALHETSTKEGQEQLVADQAWNFCERFRRGDKVDMKPYLDMLPDDACRKQFKRLVNMELLLEAVVNRDR